MAFQVFNTLSRRLDPFVPRDPPRVRLYTCGPTVYDVAHIGNFRAYVFEDVLRRHLRALGFQVTQVMNLTDVDDKTIRGARQAGVSLDAFTRPFKQAFFEDLRALRIEPAEHYPEATAHVPEMIALIRTLVERGFAYRSADGSVYFRIARFPAYGRLARLDLAGLKPGARVAQDEYQKDHVGDFALWKAWQPDDGEVAWESPWGRGRPGWHIECSAMSMTYLGPSLDLHTGGIDNMFPHHEDEIAQSEAATGQPFVTYWMHCAHLVFDGRKMSKSLGNFVTLRDLLARGYSGRDIRYALLAVHYRQTLNFTLDALDAARAALARLDEFVTRLRTAAANPRPPVAPEPEPAWVAAGRAGFARALDDDLNLSLALAALFDMLHAGNRRLDAGRLPPAEADAALAVLDAMDRVLGVLRPAATAAASADVVRRAEDRLAARRRKDWAAADRLRAEIEACGWSVQDTADGFALKPREAR